MSWIRFGRKLYALYVFNIFWLQWDVSRITIEAGSDEDVAGGSDPIVRALGRARGEGNGDEAEIKAGSDEDVPGGADPIV